MQEKLRKFRQFRPLEIAEALTPEEEALSMDFGSGSIRPGFDAKAWWKFAITSIIKSFQFKRGAIKAFKMPLELESKSKAIFRAQMEQMYAAGMDDQKRQLLLSKMDPVAAKTFWHVTSMITNEQLAAWAREVIEPVEKARY